LHPTGDALDVDKTHDDIEEWFREEYKQSVRHWKMTAQQVIRKS
jgi:hypothetical protein